MSNLYKQRGVSADKEDVHKAVKDLDKGLYPKAFCRIYPDYLAGDEAFCNIMHADGAGTKSVLAYLYWRETGDISVWRGIAQDALVMNIDDMLCVGSTGPFTYTSTIGRNASIIPGEVISEIINGTQEFIDEMAKHDVEIRFLGGETADVGDVVRTIIVDGTMMGRMKREDIIDSQNVVPGDVIVSVASFGKAIYEKNYNSGIGSNGLTSARHDLLKKNYATEFPEAVDPHLNPDVIFNGKYALTDKADTMENIGKLILSPTRTYAPLVKKVLTNLGRKVNAIIHCSGGAQTKCLHYLPDNVRIVKNNLIPPPEIFTRIREAVSTDWKEMYKVFNMGQRLEFYTDNVSAEEIIGLANELGLESQISGHVEAAESKSLIIESEFGAFEYE